MSEEIKELPVVAGFTHLWEPLDEYLANGALSDTLKEHAKAGTVHVIGVPVCKALCSKNPKKGRYFRGTFDFRNVTCKDCKRYARGHIGIYNKCRTIFHFMGNKEYSQVAKPNLKRLNRNPMMPGERNRPLS